MPPRPARGTRLESGPVESRQGSLPHPRRGLESLASSGGTDTGAAEVAAIVSALLRWKMQRPDITVTHPHAGMRDAAARWRAAGSG